MLPHKKVKMFSFSKPKSDIFSVYDLEIKINSDSTEALQSESLMHHELIQRMLACFKQ